MHEPLALRVQGWRRSARTSLPGLLPPILLLALLVLVAFPATALERTNVVFKIFQFPPNLIPTIDGRTNDWDIVPDDYAIGTDQLVDDTGKHPSPDPKTL